MRAHHKFWPKRLPHAITPPATSLWDNLAISARRYPDKAALVFFGRVFTYQDVLRKAEQLAARLAALGVAKGDRVVLNMQNCPQLVIAHFAILRANAVVVPVNPMNRAEELKHYITDPDAKVALTTSDLAAELARASDALPEAQRLAHLIVTHFTDAFDGNVSGADAPPEAWTDWLLTHHALPPLAGGEVHSWHDALANDLPLPALTVGPADLSILPYTSGTTGLPKGCMHTHASVMHNAMASGIWGNGTPENVTLAVVPMFHITGMVSVMHTTVFAGATVVIMPRWDRELAGRLISRWKVTHWTNIPTMVIDLLGSPASEVRPVQPGLHRRRRRGHAAGRGAAPARPVRPALRRRLRPDRNRRALAHQPARRPQAAVPGHPVHEHRCARDRPRNAAGAAAGRAGRNHHPRARRSSRATGSGPTPRRRPSSNSRANASSAPATWARSTKTATSS